MTDERSERSLTESQSWLDVAERVLEDPHMVGICFSFGKILYDEHYPLWQDMSKRCLDHVRLHNIYLAEDGRHYEIEPGSKAYPYQEFREARVLACIWMSLEAEEEGR